VIKKPRCEAKTRDGKPCGATPIHGKKRCLFHTGNFASELGARGGRRRAVYNPDNLERFEPPKNASDLVPLLAQTICEVRSGRIDPRIVNAVVYTSAAFLNAIEISDLDSRLKALEKKGRD
jgi:hypothetical protein